MSKRIEFSIPFEDKNSSNSDIIKTEVIPFAELSRNIFKLNYSFILAGLLQCFTSFTQNDSWKDTSNVIVHSNCNDSKKYLLCRTYSGSQKKFSVIGTSFPIVNWQIGLPQTRMEWSNVFMRYKETGWNTQILLRHGLVTYNIFALDEPMYVGATSLRLSFGKLKSRGFYQTSNNWNQIIVERKRERLYLRSKLNLIKFSGMNYGYCVEWDVTNDGQPILTQGPTLGWQRRRFIDITSVLLNPTIRTSEDGAKKLLFNQIFYFNIHISILTYANSIQVWNRSKIPLGFNTGIYFWNKYGIKKGMKMWNVELGIRGPIFLVGTGSAPPFPVSYFAFRYFFAANFQKL
jgi:hypothetical protein